MGCCVSTSDNSNRSSPPTVSAESIALTPSLEEEKVKEVLSETPKWKPTVAKFEAVKKNMGKFEAEKKTVAKFEAEKPYQKLTVAKFEGDSKVEKIMMALEINKGEEEMHQRVHRSPAKMNKNLCFSGEFNGGDVGKGKSPKIRTDQSPGRRNMKVVQSRDQIRNPPRHDNSVRRSMSPTTRADNMAARSVVGRIQSARRTKPSPAQVRTVAPRNGCRKRESPAVEQSANESLENPLVSLECFIFL